MNDTKILLINAQMVIAMGGDNLYGHPPLGILYLAAYVEGFGHSVDVLDLSIEKDWTKVLTNRLKKKKYEIVGISGTTPTHDNIKKISLICRHYNPQCTIVAGGPHVSFVGKKILDTMPIDIVIRGEGEKSFLSVIERVLNNNGKFEQIPGIITKDESGNIIDTGHGEYIKDIDMIPFPLWDKIDMKRYTHINFPVITSRGCPGKCIFCAANAMSNGIYRRRSNKNIIQELLQLRQKYNINSFLFADNTFTAQKSKVMDLCEQLIQLPYQFTWWCESRLDVITPALIQKMKKAGCCGLQIGIESANQDILDNIRKRIHVEDIYVKIKQIMDNGITNIYCTFVMGLPGETETSLKESLEMIKQLHDTGVIIETTLATPFPGTYLADHAEELGIKILHSNYKLYLFNELTSCPKDMDPKMLRNYFIESKKYCG